MSIFGKTKKSKKNKGFQYSQYWLPKSSLNSDLAERGSSTAEVLKLASIKRSISNFVRIVTNKAIPVVFSSGKDSYTTGETVVISASTKEKKFDAVVGLALHEATHCIITNFKFLEVLKNYLSDMLPDALIKKAESLNISISKLQGIVHTLWNVLEDRRIDYYMYRRARGYRPYYEAMYDKYFRSAQVELAMMLGEWSTPTLENYLNQIINITNPWFDTTALPDLDLIAGIIDLPHIDRYDADTDAFKSLRKKVTVGTLSAANFDEFPAIFKDICKILAVILDNISTVNQNDGSSPQHGPSDSLNAGSGDGDGKSMEPNYDQPNQTGQMGDSDDRSGEGSCASDILDGDEKRLNKSPSDSLKPRKGTLNKDKLKKALDAQKDFLDGNVKKKKASKKLQKQLQRVVDSGATFKDVNYDTSYMRGGRKTTRVLVIKNFNESVARSSIFPFTYRMTDSLVVDSYAKSAVEEGFRKGNILARRIQIRNQNQTTKYTRRNSGKIDKKRLHALGMNDDNVFYRLKVSEYKPVHVHLSIDASSSMSGDKFRRALVVGVALAVAADKINNLDVVLSLRAGASSFATIAIVYDSKVDKPVKIRKLFPSLTTAGCTPEGLCFEAIMDILTKESADEKYFINLSDGEPYFERYGGEEAWAHTRGQVNLMRAAGIKILSYYIERGEGEHHYFGTDSRTAFKTMYGKDSEFINPEEISGLIRTLNKLFLTK